MAHKDAENKNFCQYVTMMNKNKKHERGQMNANYRTSTAAYGRFNSRMGILYKQSAGQACHLKRVSKGDEKARQFVSAARLKGIADLDACLTWGVKILTATCLRVASIEFRSGFDHAECMDKEIAHTNKGKKQGQTWSASR